MKKVNFTQAGGFPLEEKTLDNMQTAYFDVLKTIIGHFGLPSVGNFIIYGCEVVANTIQPGMMYIDGDLCFFAVSNGNLTTKIKKIETIEDAPFEGGNNLPTYFDYSALVNANGVLLSDFERLPKVNELINQAITWNDITDKPSVVIDPADLTLTPPEKTVLERLDLLEAQNKIFQTGGGIFHWGKAIADIPPGFAPIGNMEGRILVNIDRRTDAIGQYVNPEFSPLSGDMPGKKSGTKSNTLDIENIPEHDHEVGFYAIDLAGSNDGSNQELIAGPTTANKVKTTKTGGRLVNGIRETKPFSIVPLVQTCEFIQWIGL